MADVLETYLCTNSEDEVCTFATAEPHVCSGTCIESERTYGSNLEVVGCANADGIDTPTCINFEEVLATHGVLIGNFAAPTDADTECTRLCACKCYECEHCNDNSQNLFHTHKRF